MFARARKAAEKRIALVDRRRKAAKGLRALLKPVQIVHPKGDFLHPELIPEGKVLFGRLRLLPERFKLEFQLRDLVTDPKEVLLRPGPLAL